MRSLREFFKKEWKKVLIIFIFISIVSVGMISVYNLIGSGVGALHKIVSSLVFMISLFILWPYLIFILLTENTLLLALGILINAIYIFIISCGSIMIMQRFSSR